MRARFTFALMIAGLALIAAAQAGAAPKLLWNRTESVPPGLYVVSAPEGPIRRGQLVAYLPAPHEADWLEERSALGPGWPLIKRVAGLEGDEICHHEDSLLINQRSAAQLLDKDLEGRPLPRPRGCQRLGPGELLLLADHPRSLDGRYFGAQKLSRVLGEARPVWQAQDANDS